MTKMRFGRKPGVGTVFKIMANDTDDPWSTPNTDFAKFIFNSESAVKMAYVYDVFEYSYDQTTFPPNGELPGGAVRQNYPAGSSDANASGAVYTYGGSGSLRGSQIRVLYPEKFGFSYEPMIEWREVVRSTNRGIGNSSGYVRYRVGPNGSETGNIRGRGMSTALYTSWATSQITNGTFGRRVFARVSFFKGGASNTEDIIPYESNASNGNIRSIMSVLELPAGNQPIPNYAGTPVDGQKVLRLSSSVVRMAYPGRDIGESDHDAFIFSESRIPAKIIGYGEVWVPNGGNYLHVTKRPPTNTVYLDYMLRRDDQPYYSVPPTLTPGAAQTDLLSSDYGIEPNGIRIYNTGTMGFWIRFMVVADDDSEPSTGGSKVLLQANDGTTDYIQIKRPGSHDTNPNLNDIIIDSRLPNVPIVDEGWIPLSGFNEAENLRKTIYFTNSGFRPFVKMMVSWNDNTVRSPTTNIIRTSGLRFPTYNQTTGGDSTPCLVYDNRLEFYHASGNPVQINIGTVPTGQVAEPVYWPALVGIRWYLFAIPL